MARAPRASVPKTSGQGISRLSYQKSRDIADSTGSIVKTSATPGTQDRYAKQVANYPEGKMNVDYANTYKPRNLEEVKAMGEARPSKSKVGLSLTPGKKRK